MPAKSGSFPATGNQIAAHSKEWTFFFFFCEQNDCSILMYISWRISLKLWHFLRTETRSTISP